MEKVPQKLEQKLANKYATAPVAKYGQRKPDFSALAGKKKPSPNLRKVVLVEACRTPYGRFGGALKGFSAPELGALAIKEVLRRTNGKVKPADVDYVFMGQVVAAGAGQVPSRQATILAGLPESVPSITINKVCSSGIKTIDLALSDDSARPRGDLHRRRPGEHDQRPFRPDGDALGKPDGPPLPPRHGSDGQRRSLVRLLQPPYGASRLGSRR